jgi:methylmalonyl-CoA mutase N-terminal domain/subunit
VAQGQQGIAIALDLPTQWGLDPTDPLASGEVGLVGVSLASLQDLERLLDGIDLSKLRQVSTTANAIGPAMIGMFLAFARRKHLDPRDFSLRLQNDVLKEYVARGTYILPVEPAAEFSIDAIEYCVHHLPTWVPMSISGYHMRDAGASRTQELAFTLANSREYLERAQRRGIDPVDVARSVTWFMAASSQPIYEAAKFRAARELWANLLTNEFHVTDPTAVGLRIIAYTLGGEMSAFEIQNNAVRITLSAIGAVLGGVQTLFCSSIDEAVGLPSDANALLSVRTQQIILRESGLADLVNVLGGSATVEALTDELVAGAQQLADEVDAMGGSVPAISGGWMRAQIDEEAWNHEQALRANPRIGEDSDAVAEARLGRFNPDKTSQRLEAFAFWKEHRDSKTLRRALSQLSKEVEKGVNPVPAICEVFLADGTMGEVMQVFTNRHGLAPDRVRFVNRS